MYAKIPLIVRFSSTVPDLFITVDEPQLTSVSSLIRMIRDRLSAPNNGLRLRLIYAGRVLVLETSLVEALRLQPDAGTSPTLSASAKGKAPVKPTSGPDRTYYIHASFSDALDAAALEKEKEDALAADEGLQSTAQNGRKPPGSGEKRPLGAGQASHIGIERHADGAGGAPGSSQIPTSPASQMPQGFDRLLSAGLSALEVASLRSQFLAILAHTHTPDTMPNAYELRELEERWLDNDAEGISPASGAGGAPAAGQGAAARGLFGRLGGNVADEDSSGLDDMLWGNLIGFFWPIGAVVWLMREEGVWTQRRKIAVVTGALVNLAFSIMRAAS